MGRGDAKRRALPPVIRERWSPEAKVELADLYAFADATERITELGHDRHQAFRLSTKVPIPALDLRASPHQEISSAHGRLLRRCARPQLVLTGKTTRAVPTRVVDLTASSSHLRALIASLAVLVQATTKEDATVSIPASIRDGLIGEGLADAHFSAEGWKSVPGIGAFYRRRVGTYGARLTHGTGLDHLFRRTRPDGSVEYAAVETKVCRGNGSLDRYLRRQFEDERVRTAGAESSMAPPLSGPWIADRLNRAYIGGELSEGDYRDAVRAMEASALRRVVVLIACPDYDRPGRPHVPDPDGLHVQTATGPQRLADEVVTLRVSKAVLTTLVGDISNARARSIAAIALKPRGIAARLWRQIDG